MAVAAYIYDMKKWILPVLLLCFSTSAMTQELTGRDIRKVAEFHGVQVTGVAVSQKGRVFACFPRWRDGVPYSLLEVMPDGKHKAYPDHERNTWTIGDEINGRFVCIQSILVHNEKLYVLETSNPMFKGMIAQPKIFVFDLNADTLWKTYTFPTKVLSTKSYVNDLQVDDKKKKIYLTDSGYPGLIIIDMVKETYTRVLDNHPITKAETGGLTINGNAWTNTVHSDGIAFDRKNDILYLHALTGYSLYGIPTADLLDSARLSKFKPVSVKTPAPDGMVMDDAGNLYMADLENHKIVYLGPDRKDVKTFWEGDPISWADSFAIHDGYLYFTNSRIHEAGEDVSGMGFSIYKIKL